MAKFRAKAVEAVQWQIGVVIDGVILYDDLPPCPKHHACSCRRCLFRTTEGLNEGKPHAWFTGGSCGYRVVYPGDWIVDFGHDVRVQPNDTFLLDYEPDQESVPCH